MDFRDFPDFPASVGKSGIWVRSSVHASLQQSAEAVQVDLPDEPLPGPPLVKWELPLDEMPLRTEEAAGACRVPDSSPAENHDERPPRSRPRTGHVDGGSRSGSLKAL